MPYLFSAALLATTGVLGTKVLRHRRKHRDRTEAHYQARDSAIRRFR